MAIEGMQGFKTVHIQAHRLRVRRSGFGASSRRARMS
jgi:hypothetical protein